MCLCCCCCFVLFFMNFKHWNLGANQWQLCWGFVHTADPFISSSLFLILHAATSIFLIGETGYTLVAQSQYFFFYIKTKQTLSWLLIDQMQASIRKTSSCVLTRTGPSLCELSQSAAFTWCRRRVTPTDLKREWTHNWLLATEARRQPFFVATRTDHLCYIFRCSFWC